MRAFEIEIPVDGGAVSGTWSVPDEARATVLFAHGSGSSRFSARNQYVAQVLQKAQLATLLLDLLTKKEERLDEVTAELRFDIPFLAERLVGATDWLVRGEGRGLPIGLFGASTGAAAALVCAAQRPTAIRALVSRGGRPDLAGAALAHVKPPTLLLVGGWDDVVIELNRRAYEELTCVKDLVIIPKATHLFEEPGTLEAVAQHARDWFLLHLVNAETTQHPAAGAAT